MCVCWCENMSHVESTDVYIHVCVCVCVCVCVVSVKFVLSLYFYCCFIKNVIIQLLYSFTKDEVQL